MAETRHDDFGEKIGGAKKDLWRKRGLISDDLGDMNAGEADKHVKKDNIWKKNNYQELIDSGIPADVVYFIKTVRDSIEPNPVYRRDDNTPEKRLARQKQYIDTVREIQSTVEDVKSVADVLKVYDRFLFGNGYYEKLEPSTDSYRVYITDKGRDNPLITSKLANSMFIETEIDFKYDITKKAIKEQFGVPKEEKVPRGYEVLFNDGKYSYSANNDWKPNTYYVTKGRSILKRNFETRDEALKWAQATAAQRTDNGKKRFVPTQLQEVRRAGPNYRHGKNVDGQDYINTFGFRGGEFGNWMTQNDRQASLNYGYDALKDLAVVLKISDKDISYQGALAIAFGARGSGKAVAHFEPLRNVINLTKLNGAGSLAHEWWHGLDRFLGEKKGVADMLSERPDKHPLFKKLIDAIRYKPESLEQAATRTEAQTRRTKAAAISWVEAELSQPIKHYGSEKDKSEYAALKEAFLCGETGSVDKLNDLKKRLTGRSIPKKERDTLLIFECRLQVISTQKEPEIGKVETDYYRNSKQMGKISHKDGDYWESNTEMTARAFATYVLDRLPWRSDYLVGHAECAVGITADREGKPKIIIAYPQGEERKAINAVFDEIIAELKLEQHLTQDTHLRQDVKKEEKPSLLGRLDSIKAAIPKINENAEKQAVNKGKSYDKSL